jgi:hypothetical protein
MSSFPYDGQQPHQRDDVIIRCLQKVHFGVILMMPSLNYHGNMAISDDFFRRHLGGEMGKSLRFLSVAKIGCTIRNLTTHLHLKLGLRIFGVKLFLFICANIIST